MKLLVCEDKVNGCKKSVNNIEETVAVVITVCRPTFLKVRKYPWSLSGMNRWPPRYELGRAERAGEEEEVSAGR